MLRSHEIAARSDSGRAKRSALRISPWIIYLVGIMPAVRYFYLGVTDDLGADPMKTLERFLGLWALRFLVFCLAITPLRQSFGVNLLRYRRQIGLLAFIYAALHFTTYVVLDQQLDLGAITADIIKRPYILIGLTAFTLLVPLALTSNNASIRRLGGKTWARLHKLVYAAIALGAVHFILVVKSWPPEPLIYAGIVLVLLGYRLVRSMARLAVPRAVSLRN